MLGSLCWIEMNVGSWRNVGVWFVKDLVVLNECVGEWFYCIVVVLVVCVKVVIGIERGNSL